MHVFSSEEVAVTREAKLAHYRRLIEEISLATQDPNFGYAFGSLLSAMRGPDDVDSSSFSDLTKKTRMTVPIRSVLGWQCGTIGTKADALRDTDWDNITSSHAVPEHWRQTGKSRVALEQEHHYLYHILEAVRALRLFGLLDEAKAGNSFQRVQLLKLNQTI